MDNSGKTTLARRLASDLCLCYINNRSKPKNFQDMDKNVYNFRELSKVLQTIHDRWTPISEPVYGKIIRKAEWHNEEEFGQLHEYISQINPLVVYCRPSIKTLLDFKEEQMPGVKTQAKKLIKAYDLEMEFVRQYLQVVHYDYEKNDYSAILAIVSTHLGGAVH